MSGRLNESRDVQMYRACCHAQSKTIRAGQRKPGPTDIRIIPIVLPLGLPEKHLKRQPD